MGGTLVIQKTCYFSRLPSRILQTLTVFFLFQHSTSDVWSCKRGKEQLHVPCVRGPAADALCTSPSPSTRGKLTWSHRGHLRGHYPIFTVTWEAVQYLWEANLEGRVLELAPAPEDKVFSKKPQGMDGHDLTRSSHRPKAVCFQPVYRADDFFKSINFNCMSLNC